MGERWRIGGGDGVVLEIASIRTPCNDFKAWMGPGRLRQPRLGASRLPPRSAVPGPTCVSSCPGRIRAGDPLEVVHRPGHGVTVTTMFRALHGTDRPPAPDLLAVEDLTTEARLKAEQA